MIGARGVGVCPRLLVIGPAGGGGGGTSRKVGWGCVAHFPLTLFMTKICVVCYPIYDLAKNLIAYS